ncbi:MAG: glycosyltransferase [Gemmatimonadota bacterium]
MRILHVIPSLGPARGGPSAAARLMARAGVRAGCAVDVVATNDNGRALLDVPLETALVEGGVRYIYFARDAYPYTVSRSLARWLGRHVADYDAVHIHALFSFPSTAAACAARRQHVPYIIRPLGTLARYGFTQQRMLKRMSWLLLERRILERAAAVHFTSEAERAEAARLGLAWRAEVVPLGIDVSAFSTDRTPGTRTTFLYLSRIHPKKQLHLVLKALLQLPEADLVVAGGTESAYAASLKRFTQQNGLAERVRWLGHVGDAEKRGVLRSADALVLPSLNENFGIAVLEAMASGLPVIVTRGVAIHDEIEAAGAGMVAHASPAALASTMRALLAPAARLEMGTRARALAERRFSLEAMQQELLNMYLRSTHAA